jgi:hypothetical protein
MRIDGVVASAADVAPTALPACLVRSPTTPALSWSLCNPISGGHHRLLFVGVLRYRGLHDPSPLCPPRRPPPRLGLCRCSSGVAAPAFGTGPSYWASGSLQLAGAAPPTRPPRPQVHNLLLPSATLAAAAASSLVAVAALVALSPSSSRHCWVTVGMVAFFAKPLYSLGVVRSVLPTAAVAALPSFPLLP